MKWRKEGRWRAGIRRCKDSSVVSGGWKGDKAERREWIARKCYEVEKRARVRCKDSVMVENGRKKSKNNKEV